MPRILVVDDEKMIADALGRILSKAGHTVRVVTSGLEALAELKAQTFDLAIMDLLMSELNGEELLDWIMSNKLKTKVLMMTAYGDAKLRLQLIEKGASDVLAKPFEDIFAINRVVEALFPKT